MGLKTIGFGPFKSTKTTFALSMTELGPIGAIDSEARWQWLTVPHPKIKPGAFPFDKPRIVRPDHPYAPHTDNVIYLLESQELGKMGEAAEAWTARPEIIGIVGDSMSVAWDLAQDTRDPNPKLGMLSWAEVKRFWRRLIYAMASGGKHLLLTAHAQDVYRQSGNELVQAGTRPWVEKKTPHWVELILEFYLPDHGAPEAKVIGEGIGGMGGLTKGTVIQSPTFKKVLERVTYMPPAAPEIDPLELDYRNKSAVERMIGAQAAGDPPASE